MCLKRQFYPSNEGQENIAKMLRNQQKKNCEQSVL